VSLGADVLWEDGDFAVVEAHRTEKEVIPAQTVLWPNLGPCWVAPLEVCTGIAMVTGYGHVFRGLAVTCMVVEVPPVLRRCLLQKEGHWLRWRPHEIHHGGHQVLGG
jgi:hypothetical protein